VEDVDAIIVPVGGAGLIAGVAVAAKNMNPNIKIIVSLPVTIEPLFTVPTLTVSLFLPGLSHFSQILDNTGFCESYGRL
jgi:cysteine synthase